MVSVAVPNFVASEVEVAVMVTFPVVLGAVNIPEEVIVPAEAVQLTVEFVLEH